MSWTVQSELATSVDTPPSGFIRFFPDGNDIKYKNDVGTVFTLATGLTQEQVEDIVGALIVAGSSKQSVVYDDILNTLTIDVVEANIIHQNLSGAGTNTHAQIDNHIGSNVNPHAVTAAQVGADPSGTAATEMSNHVILSDPHAQYLLESLAATVATSGDHVDLSNIGSNTHAQIDTHIASTINPHAVTKAQVGLSNVPNVDATQRANHIGTQLASTISNFDAALSNYLDRKSGQDATEQVNTTTSPVDRFNETYDLTHDGQDYVLDLHYVWAYDEGTTDFIAELLVNGVVVVTHRQEPKDTGGTGGGAGTNQRHQAHMKHIFSAIVGNNTIQLRFQSSTGGVEATIDYSSYTLQRWV